LQGVNLKHHWSHSTSGSQRKGSARSSAAMASKGASPKDFKKKDHVFVKSDGLWYVPRHTANRTGATCCFIAHICLPGSARPNHPPTHTTVLARTGILMRPTRVPHSRFRSLYCKICRIEGVVTSAHKHELKGVYGACCELLSHESPTLTKTTTKKCAVSPCSASRGG